MTTPQIQSDSNIDSHSENNTGSDSDNDVVITQHVGAPRETVFEFFTDPEKMNRWIGRSVQIDPTPGGKLWIDMTGTDIAVGTFIEVDRPNNVVFTWGWEGNDGIGPGSTTVTISLTESADDETVVELRHSGLPPEASASHRDGWTYFTPRLAAVAQGDDPGPYRHAPEA